MRELMEVGKHSLVIAFFSNGLRQFSYHKDIAKYCGDLCADR